MMATWLSNDPGGDQQLELLLRLHYGSDGLSEAASRLRLHAAALVDDILMSKLQVPASYDAPNTVQMRLVCESGRALAASRALQVAFEGFSEATGGAACISVVLDTATEKSLPGRHNPPVDRAKLLGTAKPFQVLVTQSFYAMSEIPQVYAAQHQPGVYEFLWTENRRLQALQEKHGQKSETVSFAPRPNTLVTQINDETLLYSGQDTLLAPLPPLAASPEFRLFEDQVKPRKGARVAAILGGVFAALVIVGYLVLTYTVPGRHVWEELAVSLGWAQTTPIAKTTTPVAPSVPSTSETLPPPPPPKPVTPAPRPRIGPCNIEKSSIDSFLNLAAGYMKKGQYKDALRLYSKMQNCPYGSAAAKSGMQQASQGLKDNPE